MSDLSSSTVHCSDFDPGSSYGFDVAVSDKTACFPSEPGPAYASAIFFLTETWWLSFDRDTAHEPEFSVETEFACGTNFRFPVEISFDSGCAHGPDVPCSTAISFDTCPAHENDLASMCGSDLSSTNVTQHEFNYGSAHGSWFISRIRFILKPLACNPSLLVKSSTVCVGDFGVACD
eukprot:SAG31_NODE_7730_length_1607_cov_1.777188_2_plen_176_part_01